VDWGPFWEDLIDFYEYIFNFCFLISNGFMFALFLPETFESFFGGWGGEELVLFLSKYLSTSLSALTLLNFFDA